MPYGGVFITDEKAVNTGECKTGVDCFDMIASE